MALMPATFSATPQKPGSGWIRRREVSRPHGSRQTLRTHFGAAVRPDADLRRLRRGPSYNGQVDGTAWVTSQGAQQICGYSQTVSLSPFAVGPDRVSYRQYRAAAVLHCMARLGTPPPRGALGAMRLILRAEKHFHIKKVSACLAGIPGRKRS